MKKKKNSILPNFEPNKPLLVVVHWKIESYSFISVLQLGKLRSRREEKPPVGQ